VVISKGDLMDDAARDGVLEIVNKETRPSVKALTAIHGRLDSMLVLGLGAAVEDDIDQRHDFNPGFVFSAPKWSHDATPQP